MVSFTYELCAYTKWLVSLTSFVLKWNDIDMLVLRNGWLPLPDLCSYGMGRSSNQVAIGLRNAIYAISKYVKCVPLALKHAFVEDSCRLQDIDDEGLIVTNCALLDWND
ncbi:uncharacterized protein G2W53_029837 [Senna tora]|uniref:Uncharacterized protein n=1 Tax=Senna tora TaxID=362788 RepID=A0A834WCA7_9FABA|nr:uncharacterized protein G2W53_029837 [Senna tora]